MRSRRAIENQLSERLLGLHEPGTRKPPCGPRGVILIVIWPTPMPRIWHTKAIAAGASPHPNLCTAAISVVR